MKTGKFDFRAGHLTWSLVVLLCTVACFAQVVERIWTYYQTPVKIEISLENNASIVYPGVTVCPELTKRNEKIIASLKRSCKTVLENPEKCDDDLELSKIRFDDLNVSLELLAALDAVQAEEIHMLAPHYNRIHLNISAPPFPIRKLELWTYWGRCLVIIPERPVPYKGFSTLLKLKINRREARIFQHAPDVLHRHEAFYHALPIRENNSISILLSAKEFTFQNTHNNPCAVETEQEKCFSTCTDKKMETVVKCKVTPLFNTSMKICKTWEEAIEATTEQEDFYIDKTLTEDCPCARKCHTFIYSTILVTNPDENEKGILLNLYYPENVYELTKEVFSYSFPSLVSDIGGCLGFYLGVCILQFFRLIRAWYQQFFVGNKRDMNGTNDALSRPTNTVVVVDENTDV